MNGVVVYSPTSLIPHLSNIDQSVVRVSILILMSASSFSMNGLCSVNLKEVIRNGRILRLGDYSHRKHNNPDAPTVDTVTVSFYIVLTNFWC